MGPKDSANLSFGAFIQINEFLKDKINIRCKFLLTKLSVRVLNISAQGDLFFVKTSLSIFIVRMLTRC